MNKKQLLKEIIKDPEIKALYNQGFDRNLIHRLILEALSTKEIKSLLPDGFGTKQDDVKKAYRKLAKQYHPDRNNNPVAQENFQELSLIYGTFLDADEEKRLNMMHTPSSEMKDIFQRAGIDYPPPQSTDTQSRGNDDAVRVFLDDLLDGSAANDRILWKSIYFEAIKARAHERAEEVQNRYNSLLDIWNGDMGKSRRTTLNFWLQVGNNKFSKLGVLSDDEKQKLIKMWWEMMKNTEGSNNTADSTTDTGEDKYGIGAAKSEDEVKKKYGMAVKDVKIDDDIPDNKKDEKIKNIKQIAQKKINDLVISGGGGVDDDVLPTDQTDKKDQKPEYIARESFEQAWIPVGQAFDEYEDRFDKTPFLDEQSRVLFDLRNALQGFTDGLKKASRSTGKREEAPEQMQEQKGNTVQIQPKEQKKIFKLHRQLIKETSALVKIIKQLDDENIHTIGGGKIQKQARLKAKELMNLMKLAFDELEAIKGEEKEKLTFKEEQEMDEETELLRKSHQQILSNMTKMDRIARARPGEEDDTRIDSKYIVPIAADTLQKIKDIEHMFPITSPFGKKGDLGEIKIQVKGISRDIIDIVAKLKDFAATSKTRSENVDKLKKYIVNAMGTISEYFDIDIKDQTIKSLIPKRARPNSPSYNDGAADLKQKVDDIMKKYGKKAKDTYEKAEDKDGAKSKIYDFFKKAASKTTKDETEAEKVAEETINQTIKEPKEEEDKATRRKNMESYKEFLRLFGMKEDSSNTSVILRLRTDFVEKLKEKGKIALYGKNKLEITKITHKDNSAIGKYLFIHMKAPNRSKRESNMYYNLRTNEDTSDSALYNIFKDMEFVDIDEDQNQDTGPSDPGLGGSGESGKAKTDSEDDPFWAYGDDDDFDEYEFNDDDSKFDIGDDDSKFDIGDDTEEDEDDKGVDDSDNTEVDDEEDEDNKEDEEDDEAEEDEDEEGERDGIPKEGEIFEFTSDDNLNAEKTWDNEYPEFEKGKRYRFNSYSENTGTVSFDAEDDKYESGFLDYSHSISIEKWNNNSDKFQKVGKSKKQEQIERKLEKLIEYYLKTGKL